MGTALLESWLAHKQSFYTEDIPILQCGAAREDCGGQLLTQVMWTQISVWRETSLSPVVPPKAMGELPDQPEPEQPSLGRHSTKLLLHASC